MPTKGKESVGGTHIPRHLMSSAQLRALQEREKRSAREYRAKKSANKNLEKTVMNYPLSAFYKADEKAAAATAEQIEEESKKDYLPRILAQSQLPENKGPRTQYIMVQGGTKSFKNLTKEQIEEKRKHWRELAARSRSARKEQGTLLRTLPAMSRIRLADEKAAAATAEQRAKQSLEDYFTSISAQSQLPESMGKRVQHRMSAATQPIAPLITVENPLAQKGGKTKTKTKAKAKTNANANAKK
jgi:hypothetical protein